MPSGLVGKSGVNYCHSVVGGPTSAFLSGADGIVDLAGDVTVGVSSPANLAGGVTIEVTSLADAGVASPADLAGGVTIEVTSPADAGVASPADLAEVASSADLAGDITISVLSLADLAGGVTIEVASPADAGVASPVDLAEVASSADLAGNVTVGVTFLSDPVSVVTDGMTFQEKWDVLSGSVYDCDDHCDNRLAYFDYDELGDFDCYSDEYGVVEPEIMVSLYHDLHGPDDCGVYCVSRGDTGVTPYWTGVEECDVYEGDVALPRTGSDEPFNSVIRTSPPGSGGPGDEHSDIYGSVVALHWTSSG